MCLGGGGGSGGGAIHEYHDNGATININDSTVKSALLFFS